MVHRPREKFWGDDGFGAVQGEYLLAGGLEGYYLWEVWSTREL
jgi:hypothetical protein